MPARARVQQVVVSAHVRSQCGYGTKFNDLPVLICNNSSRHMSVVSLGFSSGDSLSCLVHYCLAETRLPREMIVLVCKSLAKIKEPIWWTDIPLPMDASDDIVLFKIWFCFLEWEEPQGVCVTLKGRICGEEESTHCIYSARHMLEKVEEIDKYRTKHEKGVIEEKQTSLRFEKTLEDDWGMEATIIAEGTWGEPITSLWRALGAFLR